MESLVEFGCQVQTARRPIEQINVVVFEVLLEGVAVHEGDTELDGLVGKVVRLTELKVIYVNLQKQTKR